MKHISVEFVGFKVVEVSDPDNSILLSKTVESELADAEVFLTEVISTEVLHEFDEEEANQEATKT